MSYKCLLQLKMAYFVVELSLKLFVIQTTLNKSRIHLGGEATSTTSQQPLIAFNNKIHNNKYGQMRVL